MRYPVSRQLRTMALQTRAQVYLALDQRWEDEPLVSAREHLSSVVDGWDAEAAVAWTAAPGTDWSEYLLNYYANKLDWLAATDAAQYRELFLVCGFFETVGFTAHTKHIPPRDIVGLLGGSIAFSGRVFERHLQGQLAIPGTSPHYFEHFRWLVDYRRRQFRRA